MHLKDKKGRILCWKERLQDFVFYTDLHHVPLPQASVKDGIKRLDNGLLVKTERVSYGFCYHKDDGTACIFVSDMPLEQLLSPHCLICESKILQETASCGPRTCGSFLGLFRPAVVRGFSAWQELLDVLWRKGWSIIPRSGGSVCVECRRCRP